jgi:hypothetical protein
MVAPHSSGLRSRACRENSQWWPSRSSAPYWLAVRSFVQLFHDLDSCCPGSTIVGVHVFDKYRQALSSTPELGRTILPRLGLSDHDPGWAEKELRARDGFAITVMLSKAEHSH